MGNTAILKLFTSKNISQLALLGLVASAAYLAGIYSVPAPSITYDHPGFKDLITFDNKCNSSTVAPGKVRQLLLTRIFDGKSPFEEFPPPGIKPLLRKHRLKGWGSKNVVFTRLMTEVKPRVVIEIGTFLGASALNMASLAKKLDIDTTIICVDDFRGWVDFRNVFKDIKILNGNVMLMYQFMQNVIKNKMQDVIVPVPFSTSHSLTIFCSWGIKADLIEVDAGHTFHSAWSDINLAHALLTPNGVMFGHDYFNANDNFGVKRAVNLFAKLKGLRIEPDDQHWILRKR